MALGAFAELAPADGSSRDAPKPGFRTRLDRKRLSFPACASACAVCFETGRGVESVLLPLVGFEPPPLGRHSLYTLTAETPPLQASATDGATKTAPATMAAAKSRFIPPNTRIL